ncbi:CPBP family intramembrane metalloprotease [Ruficoccus amylovorans]|uniref:CPBP family intramembrane metalloprotease n=1 Tax=Ruficoccus amylovorans TaxID=1804625 RepID=A0A842HBX5_9BACT|nr:CPBP family intramembrane glutamic endopeptidase [Ruficoccus amylovorans]MBC2593117.1 CPBP family intramembrane metalloprotease [Ruficoccus amylovorans]
MQRERPFILFGLDEDRTSWKGVLALVFIFFGAMLFAAVASPLLYFAVKAWASSSPDTIPGWLSSRMAPEDFPRYFDRVRWLPVVLLLPWLFRWTGLFSFRRLGYRNPARAPLPLLRWWLAGMAMLAIVALIQWVTVGLTLSEQFSAGYLLEKLALGIVAGLVVALLEEMLFRGLILRLFYTALRPGPAVALAALFFAYVHFKHVSWPPGQEVHWWSGFDVCWRVALGIVLEPEWLKFLNLFATGVFLNLLFLRGGTLWPCVGVHAGWVCFRAVYTKFVEVPASDLKWLWGTQAMVDGLLPVILLTGLCAWAVLAPRKKLSADTLSA